MNVLSSLFLLTDECNSGCVQLQWTENILKMGKVFNGLSGRVSKRTKNFWKDLYLSCPVSKKKKKVCVVLFCKCALSFTFFIQPFIFPNIKWSQVATINSLIILVSYVWSLCYEDIEYSNSWYKLNCTVWYWCYIPSQTQYNVLNKQHKCPSFPILGASKSHRIKKIIESEPKTLFVKNPEH